MFLIDLESVDNLQNVMDLQKVMYKVMKVTRENVMHLAKKESVMYLPNSVTYLPKSMTYLPKSMMYLLNNQTRHVRQGKLHVACIPMKTMKPMKNHILY